MVSLLTVKNGLGGNALHFQALPRLLKKARFLSSSISSMGGAGGEPKQKRDARASLPDIRLAIQIISLPSEDPLLYTHYL